MNEARSARLEGSEDQGARTNDEGPAPTPAPGRRPDPASTAQPTPLVLEDAQRALLKAVLNRIVPARADLPGAGDLEVGGSIERTLAESPRLRRLFLDGLTDVALTAQQQHGLGFTALDVSNQIAALKTVEQRAPAFFGALVEHTYRGYYTLAAVQRAVGFEPRPPQPLGHQLPPFDPALLDLQRQRAPFWRRTR